MSTRRAFLQASAAAGMAAFGVPSIRAKDANETIQVGLIGCGGRCQHLVQSLVKIPKVHIAAVCDIWDVNLANAQKWGDGKQGATKDYKSILETKGIDAVLIATPDHWHVPITIDACAAGKDVYVGPRPGLH
jgi:predicted dehydrogenase